MQMMTMMTSGVNEDDNDDDGNGDAKTKSKSLSEYKPLQQADQHIPSPLTQVPALGVLVVQEAFPLQPLQHPFLQTIDQGFNNY